MHKVSEGTNRNMYYMFLFVPSDTFAVGDVSFSHKMHHKKRSEKRHKCDMDSGYTCTWESKIHDSFVNNDTVPYTLRLQPAGAADVCGLRIADADPQ